VRSGETWGSIKSRIQTRLGLNDKDWSKIRVALVSQMNTTFIEKEEDETALKSEVFTSFSHNLKTNCWIGVEHVNKAPKRSRYSTLEKAIKIYN